MADLDNLNLAEEEVLGVVDYDAPEVTYTPQLAPGVYDFKFELEDEPFQMVDIKGGKYLQINHKATVANPETGEEHTIRFQRATFYKSDKMPNSQAGDLLRSLGIRLERVTKAALEEALRGADGRSHGRAEFGWRAYCKTDALTIATSPNKKKGDIAWPRNAETKQFEPLVKCPKCNQSITGREEILRYKLPEAPLA